VGREDAEARGKELPMAREKGLGLEEVQKRLKENGYSEVLEKKTSPLSRFLKKFWGLIPWMREITVALE
jgi:H+-transporting ATPase